jgi:hypothetical protein
LFGGISLKYEEWQKKRMERSDLSQYLIHLTRAKNDKSLKALDVLFRILMDKKLIGSTTETGFIVGDNNPAVCFQDAPLFSVGQNIWYENNKRKNNPREKERYNAYGLIFTKKFIYKNGGRPVIYDKTEEAKEYIHKSQWWRIVNLDLSNSDNIIDWTHEREWRVPRDLNFDLNDVVVVLPNDDIYRQFMDVCLANKREDIIKNINGIVNLSYIF